MLTEKEFIEKTCDWRLGHDDSDFQEYTAVEQDLKNYWVLSGTTPANHTEIKQALKKIIMSCESKIGEIRKTKKGINCEKFTSVMRGHVFGANILVEMQQLAVRELFEIKKKQRSLDNPACFF